MTRPSTDPSTEPLSYSLTHFGTPKYDDACTVQQSANTHDDTSRYSSLGEPAGVASVALMYDTSLGQKNISHTPALMLWHTYVHRNQFYIFVHKDIISIISQ